MGLGHDASYFSFVASEGSLLYLSPLPSIWDVLPTFPALLLSEFATYTFTYFVNAFVFLLVLQLGFLSYPANL